MLRVDRAAHVTPHMVRITFAGDALEGIPLDCAGANCKLMFPEHDQSLDQFRDQLDNGPKPVRRTYTVRQMRSSPLEMDIDFVAHGDNGPASRWASHAKPGDFCAFAGPGKAKVVEFYADWYLLAADMSALPVASATLEAMPGDAKGVAVFEVLSDDDIQDLNAPDGVAINWIVTPDPYSVSREQERFIRNMPWPDGVVQTCIAGESGTVRAIRDHLHKERGLNRKDTYISGYWKIGMIEDEHQAFKKLEN
ncbi:MAG: siderophore-interacting protein [Pseudomonadota bacterium]